MPKQIIIAEQHRIAAVFSEDQIQELIVATGSHQVGDIYLGIVENVLPGIDAAFVNIGDAERNGFIHVSDLGPLRLRRSAGSITELLAPQQKVLVQVMKEPTGNKGPRLTGNISLPGRYLVLMPFGRGVNLSRRIRNENERNRLRALAILVKPAGMGLLVRTEAEGMAEDAIIEDLEMLQRQWETIQQEAMSTRPPSLLNRDDDFIQKVLRDVYSADVNRIVVDSHTGLKRVKQHLVNWSGGKSPQGVLIDHHRDRTPILEFFRVNAAIREALKPRVDLPSGGYIIIERTEALTVIDVNSGSFTRSATARETVLWTNSEAATEIARQLRLRNIAGVIVVDFIDMDSRRDQLQVLEHFNKLLRADKARPQIAQLTELGLVELTRKRQGQNLYELFGQSCPTCGGLGHLAHLPGEGDRIVAEPLETARVSLPSVTRTVQAPPTPTWDEAAEEFDLDASADLQSLDLVNHPSYQERNRGDSRRRRRSSKGGRYSEPVAKNGFPTPDLEDDTETIAPLEEVTFKEPILPSPVKEGRPERVERGDRSERGDRGERGDRSERVERGDRSERGDRGDRSERVERGDRSERGDRGRSGRREKTPAEPPQVISVEMTPEEQEMYALMGISPLVLTTESIKDAKSVILSVTLPGESSRSNGATSDVEASAFYRQPEPVLFSTSINDIAPPVSDEDESESNEGESEPEDVSAVAIATADDQDESADGGLSRRRRRRRSSVSSSDNSSS